ncbi:uncharacterized protein LOC100378593 [Saccoglossus kowalevskii]|uniref:Uncharacterized protein LOC100378593 n=1 Tax=Saccoglossus kowalevskii TaxID=10224 RepID=A0ABM0GXZ8_SACKO|nr:PREDICTED: uncharacterized protein LOC100378593 [Saccoglossus kowalevskii]
MIGTMITQSLDPVIEATAFYSIIFCSSGVTTDWTPTTTVSSCDNRMDAASQECHAPFMAIFNEDRVDDRLCDAYKTMVSCETGKVRELCPDASDMEVGLDEQSRAMANYFCVEDDSVKSTVKSITTTVTSEVIATTSDDGVGAASVAKLSSITCGLLFLMAFYFLL